MTTSSDPLDELRRDVEMFENTWTLATVLATALVVLCWYFSLAQVSIGSILWTLFALALGQLTIGSQTQRVASPVALQRLALSSQLLGTLLIGVAWHLFGGVQQPLFPLFVVLPLIPAARVMGFWQAQAAMLGLIAVLVSGLLLSPETNSFIAERYGVRMGSAHALPEWLPRSTVAFPDVSTSPTYNLVLIVTIGIIGLAVSTSARALVALSRRGADRLAGAESELARLQQLNKQLITHAPSADVVVSTLTGRIVQASDRFASTFDVPNAAGQFLLDTIAFAYPAVIRQLMSTGGEEIQEAKVRGRDALLRVRSQAIGSGSSQTATLNIEICDELCWRGAVDVLEEPVLAVNALGHVVFLNRAAATIFGQDAHAASATALFGDAAGRWWDIAPLDSARRILNRGEQRYRVSIRRWRIAASVGELSYVYLQVHEPAAAAAA